MLSFRVPRPFLFSTLLIALFLAGCAKTGHVVDCDALSPAATPNCAPTFAAYRQETAEWLRKERQFVRADNKQELDWNLPTEYRPTQGKEDKGILLVHGLGDSPWTFTDIAPVLAAQGFVVRTMLIPGHGTKPADMRNINIDDWTTAIARQVALFSQEVKDIYLGGFSTGTNLVTSYAITHPDIRGLVLFSPAFRAQNKLAWLLPIANKLWPWFRSPEDSTRPQQTEVRYTNMPTNGFLQFYNSSQEVASLLKEHGFDRPAILIMTEHDSVVDIPFALTAFTRYFTHPASKLIWYGKTRPTSNDTRIIARTDYLPEQRISQFSHMGLLYAPDNAMYGRNGTRRFCGNRTEQDIYQRCMTSPESGLWYADWGYSEPGKLHARLTFNPYFRWQSDMIINVLTTQDAAIAETSTTTRH